MTNETLSTKLTARLTAADMGEDFAAAVRAMADEPGEVSREIGCSDEEVTEWCRASAEHNRI